MRCINNFSSFGGVRGGFLFFIYVAIVLFCNYTLGIFHLTDVDYHKSFDTISYIDAAKLMLDGMQAHSLRCFGFAGFLALPYSLFKSTPTFFWFVYVLQNVLLLLSFRFIYKIIVFYTNETKAFLAVLLLMINITYIVFAFHVMTEIGFLFLMISAFYGIHLYLLKNKNSYLLISFLAICIATLFRPGMLYFNIIVGLVLSFYFLFKKKNIFSFLILLLTFLSTIGFQAYKINQQFGMYKISFIDDVTIYRYLNTATLAHLQGTDKLYLMNKRDSLLTWKLKNIEPHKIYIENHQIVKNETFDLIKNYPFRFLIAFSENLLENFHTGNAFIRDMPEDKIINTTIRKRLFDYTRIWNMFFVIALFLMNLFLIIQFIRKKLIWTKVVVLNLILLIYCDYSFATSGISYFQGDRFNVVWMPMLLISIILVFSKKKILPTSF